MTLDGKKPVMPKKQEWSHLHTEIMLEGHMISFGFLIFTHASVTITIQAQRWNLPVITSKPATRIVNMKLYGGFTPQLITDMHRLSMTSQLMIHSQVLE
ncbi:MAG: hypothetical protein FD155_374 [Bacteroidetes bacterium]|nr:MAG: hypothetical protein FD155_374 [Bacteroidota bacterium]